MIHRHESGTQFILTRKFTFEQIIRTELVRNDLWFRRRIFVPTSAECAAVATHRQHVRMSESPAHPRLFGHVFPHQVQDQMVRATTRRGSSFVAFKRLLPPVYENGFNLPIGTYKSGSSVLRHVVHLSGLHSSLTGWSGSVKTNGFSKPSARLMSTPMISSKEVTSDLLFTHMLRQWGQFLDHDLDHAVPGVSAESFGEHVDCRT